MPLSDFVLFHMHHVDPQDSKRKMQQCTLKRTILEKLTFGYLFCGLKKKKKILVIETGLKCLVMKQNYGPKCVYI